MSVRGEDNERQESETRLAATWSNVLWSIPLVLFSVVFIVAAIGEAIGVGDMPGPRAGNFVRVAIPASVFTFLAVRILWRGVVISDVGLTVRRLVLSQRYSWETIERLRTGEGRRR